MLTICQKQTRKNQKNYDCNNPNYFQISQSMFPKPKQKINLHRKEEEKEKKQEEKKKEQEELEQVREVC